MSPANRKPAAIGQGPNSAKGAQASVSTDRTDATHGGASRRVAGNVATPRTIDHALYARERARNDLPSLEKGVYRLARSMRHERIFLTDRAGWKMAVDRVVDLMFDDDGFAEKAEQRRAELWSIWSPRGDHEERHTARLCKVGVLREMRETAAYILTRAFIAERRRWLMERARMLVDTGQSEATDVSRENAVDWEFQRLMGEDIAILKARS